VSVGKVKLELASLAKEGMQTTHNLPLAKKNAPVLVVRLLLLLLLLLCVCVCVWGGSSILTHPTLRRESSKEPAPVREVLEVDGHEFQLRTADTISEADTSCCTDTVL